MSETERDAQKLLDYLASVPDYANTTVTRKVFRAALLSTGGWIMSRGRGWDIIGKHAGAGIYRVTLAQRIPTPDPGGSEA